MALVVALLILVLCAVAILGVSNVARWVHRHIARPLSAWTSLAAVFAVAALAAVLFVATNYGR